MPRKYFCDLCNQEGKPANSQDFPIKVNDNQSFSLGISFQEAGSAAGQVPTLCEPCKKRLIQAAAETI